MNKHTILIATIALLIALVPMAAGAQQGEITCETDYTVQAEDWLSKIAEKAYGDYSLYPGIAAATNAKATGDSSYNAIDSHDIIEPGWKLCLPGRVQAEELTAITPFNPDVLTIDALEQVTISGINEDPITLTDGVYENPAEQQRVELISNSARFGDLDGDGVEDAVVFVAENSGGTGVFTYVAAQLNKNGVPTDAGAVWVGDRIQIKEATIENGQVALEIITQGPGDAACCASHKANTAYALQNGALAEVQGVEGQELTKISADDLNGSNWTLVEMDRDTVVPAQPPVTLTFAEGQISGSGGCNSYTSSFTLAGDNPSAMTIGPVASTKMACPDPVQSQETAYFSALQNTSQWGYVAGQLAMYYETGDSFGRLLFIPAEASTAAAEAPAPGERITSVVELTATPWQWVSFTDPTQQFDITDPEKYTVTFNSDNTAVITADCHNPLADYTADDSGNMSIAVGPMAMMICPDEGSRGEEFVTNLGFVSNFFIQDGFLYLDMMADGGTLKLSPGSEHMPAGDAAVESSASFGAIGTVTPVTCPEYVNYAAASEAEVEGETYECGLVTVPENYADPNGRAIELMYLRLFSPSDSPASDPLLYLSGGPGGSALAEMEPSGSILLRNLMSVREDRDLVFYDQRGTGLSNPILCGPSQAIIGSAIELVPEITEEEITAIEEDGIKAYALNQSICAEFYNEVGVDLAQYNSIASAKDMAGLMTALGYGQYNLYGTSYGTKLAQVAMRETPDRLSSVVIDGVSPLNGAVMANSGIEFNEQYTRIFEQCAQNPACNQAYPNLPERFTALLDNLKENPIVLDEPIVSTGFIASVMPDTFGSPQVETIDIAFMRNLTSLNNLLYNNLLGNDLVIIDQMPRLILALEEGDIEYVRSVFQMPELEDSAPVDEVAVIEDEKSVIPDNDYIAASIEALLAEAETALSDAATPEEQWVALAINDLSQRLVAGEEQVKIVENMVELTALPYQGLDSQSLIDYANAYLSEAVATEANAIAQPMTEADVRATLWHIHSVAAAMSFTGEKVSGIHEGLLFAVNCAEDINLRSAASVDEAMAAAAYPQLGEYDETVWPLFELLCSYYPESNIDAGFIQPVSSDIPTLLLQGGLDTQTPLSGALETADYLPNAIFVQFPSEGHVVGSKSVPCPGDITAQFLNNPAGEVDASCADAFVIDFELPE